MTNRSRNVRQAVQFALAACASAAAPLAFGADAAAPANPDAVQEVVVTGSRIAQSPNDVSISPITSVSAVDIQQTGLIRTEDVLQNLPSISAESPSGNSISSVGINTVSLRGLGSQRTLVLIDGRRMNPGGAGGVTGPGGSSNAADLNQIPADLIERVDVLTGGASAVYGADAVAGVVNFVLNTHYQGVRVDADYSFNNHKNDNETYLGYLRAANQPIPQDTVNTGQNRNVSILAGANFADGKGNATTYFTYTNSLPAVGYQFDHAACTLNAGKTPTSAIFCGGSSTSGPGRFFLLGKLNVGLPSQTTTAVVDNTVDPKTGAFRAYNGNTDSYNYGALSYFQRSQERYTAGGFLHYDINDYASVYTETMYARNTSTAQYGPSGAFAFTAYPLQKDNPLLTPEQVATIFTPANVAANHAVFGGTDPNQVTMYLGRRNVEGGGRLDQYQSSSIRQLIGVKGSFADAWNYDTYAQVGITQFQDIEGNFLGVPQINAALDVIPNPTAANGGIPGVAAGTAVCRSALPGGANPTCVPWNIYKPGGVTPDQLKYLSVPATYASNATEYIWDGSVTGDLGKYGVKLPTAKDGLSINVGAEYREEKFKFDPDFIFANGLQAGGAPSQAIDGRLHVWEGFTEVRLPIMNDLPFAYSLSADAGYRFSNYTLGGTTNTYKFGVEWAPIPDVRLRGGYNRAVRAPNLDELFEPPVVGAGGTADPCWGPNPVLSQAQCERTGVTQAQYGHIVVNPAAQINTQVGGNIALKPEIADTYTFGVVLQPQFIPNLVASFDAYYIKIRNTITSLSSNTIINDCALTGDAALCGLIHRGPTGSLWFNTANFVTATNENIGKISARGLDVSSHYHMDVGNLGKLSFNLTGTYTKDFNTQPLPTGGSYDCAGYWGTTCGAPLPHWRHVLNTTWGLPWFGIDLTARWRLVGPSKVDRSSSNPQLNAAYYVSTAHIPGYNYIDVSASMPVTSWIDFRMGVNNIADKNPPLILNGTLSDCPNTSCNDNTWVGTYDSLGRYLYAHVTMKF
ncbi:MAG: TonB-dependent receptor [Proteobacteria bacterium]|nr:TonB-dependent receptor [Pseudomonadota bacterium]